MRSFGMLTARALSIASRRRGLAVGSGPPIFTEIWISRSSLVQTFERRLSSTALRRLSFAHRLWPDMSRAYHARGGSGARPEDRGADAQVRRTRGDRGLVVRA